MPFVSVLTAELGFKDREGTGRSLWSMLGERKRLGLKGELRTRFYLRAISEFSAISLPLSAKSSFTPMADS
jgi:hypothetical protein